MENLVQKRMLEITSEMFVILMEKRRLDPSFTFALRKKNARDRTVEKGFWFQGSDYLCVPLFKPVDNDRKISTIGFIIEFDEAGRIKKSYIQFSFKTNSITKNERKLYVNLAIAENCTFSKYDVVILRLFDKPDEYIENLRYYLEDFRPKVITLLQQQNLTGTFLIPEEEFIKTLNRVEESRSIMKTLTDPKHEVIESSYPLNQILFGPPGTGKTYHTINRSLEIIDPKFYSENKDNREALHKKFDSLLIKDWNKDVGQIAFCTFHQSMSYEDFIEGIKPLKPDASGHVKYDVLPGFFKQLSQKATDNIQASKASIEGKASFETAWTKLVELWDENPEMKFGMKTAGKEFIITDIYAESIPFRKASGGTGHTLSKKNIRNAFYGEELRQTGLGIYYPGVVNKLRELSEKDTIEKISKKKFVLIIDEINRGNVSQIFGELITLIEEDKRDGKPEALEVILPYSKDSFSVPPNLHIIGTMNTADRSVEALDTALRRRFVFEEMPPRHELLNPKAMICRFWNTDPDEILNSLEWKKLDWDKEPYISRAQKFYSLFGLDKEAIESNFLIDSSELWDYGDWHPRHLIDIEFEIDPTGINLENILRTINSRIEVLLSKDHQIGHSYFMKVYSEDELKTAFYKSIIPLLQEYFYGDYGKIGLVLGRGFVASKMIEKPASYFDFPYDGHEELASKAIYEIVDYRKTTEEQPKFPIQLTRDKSLNFSFLDAVRRITDSNYEPKP